MVEDVRRFSEALRARPSEAVLLGCALCGILVLLAMAIRGWLG